MMKPTLSMKALLVAGLLTPAAGMATAEQLQTSILVAQQMFISEVIDNKEWFARL